MRASTAKASKSSRKIGISKQGVLVLGMHRSGTSAVTRVLNLLGCALPDSLIGPGDGNELGHWEALDAVALNDEILASSGSSWEDWGPINEDWRRSGIRSEMLARVSELVRQHAALGPLFALKDPRLCRLADLWLEGMDAAEVEPLVILMVRNPLEVVRSLESRDLMNPGYGQLLWLRHVLHAEFASRGRKRVVCRYDQMMRNWAGMIARIKSGLGLSLPRNSPAARAEVDAFLTTEQRHQALDLEAALDDPWLTGWSRQALAILVRWSEQGEDAADHDELDRIRFEFDNAYGALAGIFVNAEAAGSVGSGSRLKAELNEQLGHAHRAADEAEARIRQAEADHAAAQALQAEQAAQLEASQVRAELLEAELARLRADIENLGQEAERASALAETVAELIAELDVRNARTAELEAQLHALDAAVEAASERGAELERGTSQLRTALETAQADASEVKARLPLLEERLEAATHDLHDQVVQNAELTGRLSVAESTLIQRQEELTQLWEQLLKSGQAVSAAQTEAEQERQRRLEVEERAAALKAEVGDLRHLLEASETAAKNDLAQRDEEIARLTLMLHEREAALQASDTARAAAEQDLAERTKEYNQLLARLDVQEAAHREAQAAREAAERDLTRRSDEIAQLTVMLREQEAAAAQALDAARSAAEEERARLSEEHVQLLARLEQQETARQAAEASRIGTEQKLAARFDEIGRLTALLVGESEKVSKAAIDAEWLRSVNQTAQNFPKWWAVMPSSWRRRREHARYRRAGLFDAQGYLELYPDVAADGMDPMRHYILHGMVEGRAREG